MPPSNTAAWLTKPKTPLAVSPAPYTPPGRNQIVIRNRAIGVNFCDWAKQDIGGMIFPWAKLPYIMGEDVAGEVVEIGPGDNIPFKVGDRVLGHCLGLDKISAGSSEGAFQEYVVLRTVLVSRIPDSVSFERACVLPVCLSTAATGLFCDKHLSLDLPSVDNHAPTSKEGNKASKVLVVWGASTAVGMNCVQLAVGAGYKVVATAGRHNFDYVSSLGASSVFDYRDANCARDVIKATQQIGSGCTGAVAIGADSIKPCIDIVAACCKGTTDKAYVAQMSLNGPPPPEPGVLNLVNWLAKAGYAWFSTLVKKNLKGVKVEFIWGSDLYDGPVAEAVYGSFLPEALAQGNFVPAPEPLVVGHGLDKVQEAFEVGRKGVSAKKLVVTV